MINDIFYIPSTTGFIYGLFSKHNPLQIRYIGQTKYEPIVRLRGHFNKSQHIFKLKKWIRKTKPENIGMRILGKYPYNKLNSAEKQWTSFWSQYCDIFNRANNPHYRDHLYSLQKVKRIKKGAKI